MNNRERMRATNAYATKWLLRSGYDEVWLKPHYKFNNKVYCQKTSYDAQDIFNLHDGICKGDGEYIYLQISTDKLHSKKEYIEESKKYCITVMLLAPVKKDKESKQYLGIKIVFIRNGKIIDDDYYED